MVHYARVWAAILSYSRNVTLVRAGHCAGSGAWQLQRWCRGLHLFSVCLDIFTMRHKLQILLQQILAIFIHIWIWSTLCQSLTPAPDPGSKLHLHMWVYHIKSLLTRPLRVLNPCFPMLNKIAKFLHHFLRLRHRNPPRKSAAFCRYISNISNKLMRVVDWELFNFDID